MTDRQIMTGDEIRRAIVRISHEIVEKQAGTQGLAIVGIQRRGVPLATRIAGAIVRLEPPAELTDVQIDNVRSAFVAAGAVAVRMLPKLSAGQVVAPERTEDRSSVASVRSVVMKMVDEARVTDREAVRSIVEKVLAEEGL